MKIRLGVKEDIAKISDCLRKSWLMHADKESAFINRSVMENSTLEEYFSNCFDGSGNSYLLIADLDDEIAGFAKVNVEKIQSFFNVEKILYIDDLCTLESHLRKGVASFILKEVEKFAKEKGIGCLKARVYNFNQPAQATFNGAGFKDLYSEYFKIVE